MFFIVAIWSVAVLCWLLLALFKWNQGGIRVPLLLWGLAIIVCGSVIGHDFFHIPAPIPVTSDRALLGLLIATFAFLVLRRKASIRKLVATDYLSVGLLLVLATSAIFSDWSYKDNRPISRLIFFYLVPISLYFVIKNIRITDGELKITAIAFCGFCIYLASTAVAESLGWYGLVFPTYIRDATVFEFLGRGRGPFLNPVSNGIFLTAGLATAMMLWKLAAGNWKEQVIWSFTIPILVAGNICTLTRSVWVGMVVGVGFVIWMVTNRRQKGAMLVLGTVAAVVIFAALGSSLVSFKRDKHVTQNEMAQSAQLRPIFATIAWEMFKDRPFFGCGFGQYGKHKFNYLQNPNSGLPLRKAAPYLQHNVVLSLLTEVGFIGCGLFLLLIFKSFQESYLVIRTSSTESWRYAYSLILIAMLISYMINGMFHDVSIIPMANTLLFYLLAIVVALRAEPLPEQAVAAESRGSWTPGNQVLAPHATA